MPTTAGDSSLNDCATASVEGPSAPCHPDDASLLIASTDDPFGSGRSSPPFNLQTLRKMATAWRRRVASTPPRDRLLYALIVAIVWLSFLFQFFGLNWWIASFPNQSPSSFLQMIVPAILWATTIWIPAAPYKCCVANGDEDMLFWIPSKAGTLKGVGLLVLLGTVDAFGGLTAVYAIPNVGQFLQSMIYATGPLVTWLLAKLISPKKAPPMNPWLAVTFVLSIAAVIVASAQQADTMKVSNVGWLFIFFLSSAFPNLYNVVQGAFLTRFERAANVSHWTAKYVALLGDLTVQVFVTMLFFPLDSVPWFGSSTSFSQTWTGTIDGVRCIGECQHNAIYFALYVIGFVVSRASNAFLNHYSPTLGAFINQFGGPISALLLIIIPSWSTSPNHAAWYLQVICLGLLVISSLVYSVYEEAARTHDSAAGEVAIDGPAIGAKAVPTSSQQERYDAC